MFVPNGTLTAVTLDSVSSSEAASLHGHKAKTPIIAGSICGGVVCLAWLIGFAIYFRKRYKRKLRNQGKLPAREKKSIESNTERIIIPPDPAILMGYQPGERYVRGELQSSNQATVSPYSENATSRTGSVTETDYIPHNNMAQTIH
ncbi:hypothetical protein GYMLUDRAFT_257096 [Collybiopsis luxurians FD-317 M1]|nr:hypothetical protein GYMLUDRAFT_257096 [Collybiopsis luxurians FD-317 M1]